MNIANLVEKISNTIDSVKTPVNFLPPILLRCTSLMRSGLSPYKITARIIENNGKLGLETGFNPDGTRNLVNAYTYNVVKEMVYAIQNEASVQTAIPAASLLLQTNGANAGGPVVSFGTNLLDSLATGIMH